MWGAAASSSLALPVRDPVLLGTAMCGRGGGEGEVTIGERTRHQDNVRSRPSRGDSDTELCDLLDHLLVTRRCVKREVQRCR